MGDNMNNKPKRILHVLGGLNLGGAETMIMNYYRNIDRNIIQFDFVIHTEKKQFYEDEIKKMGGKIYRLPKYKLFNHFNYKRKWKKFFVKHPEYQVIHGHMRSTASIYLKIAKKFKLITISHSHSMGNGKGIIAIIKNLYCKKISDYSDYYFACSDEAAIWLFGKNVIKSNKYVLLKNAIDLSKYSFNNEIRSSVRKELNIENDFVIGHIGRFCYQKNHKFLIELFKTIYDLDCKNVKLLLVGTGELKDKIIEQCEIFGIKSNVIFLENRNDINNLLQAMDVFCFPSHYEGLGIVAIESQASGLFTLVSDKVPTSVLLTNDVVQLPLNKKIWLEEIEKCKNKKTERNNNYTELKKYGYDIKNAASKLENFYFNLSNNNKS